MRVILFVCFVWLLIYFGQLHLSDGLLLLAGICLGALIVWLRENTKKEAIDD
jgi:uncharacterized Tic20 family protein